MESVFCVLRITVGLTGSLSDRISGVEIVPYLVDKDPKEDSLYSLKYGHLNTSRNMVVSFFVIDTSTKIILRKSTKKES